MSKAVDMIKALEASSGRLEKERIMRETFENGDREFFTAARICLDPTVSYGVKKITVIDEEYAPGDLTFSDFMKFAERLRKRDLTGHAALHAMHAAAERSDTDEWNFFYRRILLKDFKAGFDHSTVNRVLTAIGTPEAKSFMVPVFQCQLAKSGDEHPNKMVGPKFLDVKLNGVRLLTLLDVEAQTVTQYTRNGNENNNFPHIREEFAKLLPELPVSMVFDGEVVGRTFQELMSQLRRGTDVQTEDHKLALFDMVPLKDFRTGKCALSQRKRHEGLCEFLALFAKHDITAVTILPKIEVDLSTEDGKKRMSDFRDEVMEAARAAGDANVFEGFMIKDPDAPYVCKKGTNWLKWKKVLSVDLTIVDVEEGKDEGKYVGLMGALVCEGVDNGKNIKVNVGSGFSDQQRIEFWNNRKQLIGQIVEIEYDEITLSATSDIYSLRFPRFYRFRSINMIVGEKD